MKRVLITGGTGFVGSHTVERYLDAGWTVRALVRDRKRLSWLEGLNIELALGSLTDESSLQAAVRECDTVVHCAGLTKARRAEEFYRINSDAVGVLVEAARDAGVKRFIFCSSQAAAGPSPDGEPLTESADPNPVSEYGLSKLRGEQKLQALAGDMEWVILRPPAIIGPRDWQFLPLFRGVKRLGLYPQFGGGRQLYSYAGVQDVARALLRAGEVNTPVNQVFFVCQERPVDWFEVSRIIAELSGRHVRRLVLPAGLLRIAGSFADATASITGKPALLSREKVREILTPGWICSPKKIKDAWGFSCEDDLRRVIVETYEFYRTTGHL